MLSFIKGFDHVMKDYVRGGPVSRCVKAYSRLNRYNLAYGLSG